MDLYGFNSITLNSPVRSEVSSFTDLGGPPERFAELITMDSLFSVLKENLTSLTKATNGLYYIRGNIKDSDQQALYNYTERIGDLTLGREQGSARLASSVLVQVAHHQDPNKPLFPHLHHLRIIEPSSSLDFLHVILSSALVTLELTAVPEDDPHYPSVLSFLERAVDEAPNLSTLILGPGLIGDQILNISLRYQNLRHLKFLDVEIAITDQLLHAIGSLQHLETLVLRDNGNSTYMYSPAIPTSELAISFGQRRDQGLEHEETVQIAPSPGPSHWNQPTAPYVMIGHETIPEFSNLSWSSPPETADLTFLDEQAIAHFNPLVSMDSPPELAVSRVSNEDVWEPRPFDFGHRSPSPEPNISFSSTFERGRSPPYEPRLVTNEPEVIPQSPVFFGHGGSPSPETASSARDGLSMKPETPIIVRRGRSPSPGPTIPELMNEPREAIVDSTLFCNLRSLDVSGSSSSRLIEDLVEKVSPYDLQELSIDFTKLLERISVATASAQGLRRAKGKKKSCVALASLQPAMPPQPSPETLVRRSIQKWGHTLVSVSVQNHHTTGFSLPFDVFENLVLRPDMKHLEITGIDIDFSMDGTFDRLKDIDSKLEVLHLPVHFGAPGISPPQLRDIAKSCPRLTSFRCRLIHLSCLSVSLPLSHQLEVLTVSNERDHLEEQLLPKLARYLDSIFPGLKSIQAYDENGNNAQQWRSISTLVKSVCQAVRMDEVQRLQSEASM